MARSKMRDETLALIGRLAMPGEKPNATILRALRALDGAAVVLNVPEGVRIPPDDRRTLAEHKCVVLTGARALAYIARNP